MALRKTITTDFGITVNDAYHKIETVGGNKNNVTITVNAYVTQEASQNGTSFINQKTFNFIPAPDDNSLRWDKQAYEYLKTLDEYKDAADC